MWYCCCYCYCCCCCCICNYYYFCCCCCVIIIVLVIIIITTVFVIIIIIIVDIVTTRSLGCILYQLCHPNALLLFSPNGRDDNLDNNNLLLLQQWTEEVKHSKLLEVKDIVARNLLKQMLVKDPTKRITIERILNHPFLSGKNTTRMLGLLLLLLLLSLLLLFLLL